MEQKTVVEKKVGTLNTSEKTSWYPLTREMLGVMGCFELSGKQMAVLLALVYEIRDASESTMVWPSQANLQNSARCGKGTVQSSLNRLMDLGLILKDKDGTSHKSTRYDVGPFLALVRKAIDEGEYPTKVQNRTNNLNGKKKEDLKPTETHVATGITLPPEAILTVSDEFNSIFGP